MRINLSIAAGNRGVWVEARKAAHADRTSVSDLAACALREYLERRAKRLAKGVSVR
jgi:hypothetical protein